MNLADLNYGEQARTKQKGVPSFLAYDFPQPEALFINGFSSFLPLIERVQDSPGD